MLTNMNLPLVMFRLTILIALLWLTIAISRLLVTIFDTVLCPQSAFPLNWFQQCVPPGLAPTIENTSSILDLLYNAHWMIGFEPVHHLKRCPRRSTVIFSEMGTLSFIHYWLSWIEAFQFCSASSISTIMDLYAQSPSQLRFSIVLLDHGKYARVGWCLML